ncbi:hypothetical protein HFO45_17070 [Rhizobium leguminosarum]|uniref:hypothetical protein n=1 Tax=Rhizobium leguminosarum TaxID=384 RepID=UPI001C96D133|nr:hypothetical protein [Rhizobium leguminosarum]MBY5649958.1 hypothetical protein [Rhizobium leguminosarum]
MKPDDLSDEELLYVVGHADKQLFEAGSDIRRRQWEVPQQLMRRFGYIGFVMAGTGKPAILDRIEKAFASIYRKQDIAMGGHIGVFMYRDIFARIGVPHIYGQVQLNPFEFVELTQIQKRIISTEEDQIAIFLDQFSDVSDIQYGISEVKKPYAEIELVGRFLGLARLHLHSASAVLTGGYDFRGAVQASLLATELALKAGAAANGLSEREIKDEYGHHTLKVASFLNEKWPSFDVARVVRALKNQPQYVPNRYAAEQPARREVGHLVMNSQYIVSEVVRQVSDRDFRSGMTPTPARSYPA